MIPEKVMATLRIRFANHPAALIVLAELVGGSTEEMVLSESPTMWNGGSTEEMVLGSTEEMVPEPLTEPLTEHPRPAFGGLYEDSEEEKKEKESGEAIAQPLSSPQATTIKPVVPPRPKPTLEKCGLNIKCPTLLKAFVA